LGEIVAYSPDDIKVDIYAADTANGLLIQAPYIVDMDPNPVVPNASHTEPVFEDTDGNGDAPKLQKITLSNGWTTTEDWTIIFDGSFWRTEGSVSGLQSQMTEEGELFQSDHKELMFRIKGAASRGDRFSFRTETGIIEHDLGGNILAMQRLPFDSLIVAAVWDPFTERSAIVVWDLELKLEIGRYLLPEGAQAWRMTFGASMADLFVADAHHPRIFKITLNLDDPATSGSLEIPTAAPVSSLAYVHDAFSLIEEHLSGDDLADTGAFFDDPALNRNYEHLFVGLVGLSRIDVLDLRDGRWIDVNPLDDIDGGLQLESPIIGLSATPDRVLLGEYNDVGTRVSGKVVAATMYSGSLVLLEGDSGCMALNYEGPHVPINQGFESIQFNDVGNASNPDMLEDESTARRVQMSSCGGVVRTEEWTVTFDEVLGNWEVEGTLSGVQDGRALEGERYVSDTGAISFTMVAGVLPASEGDSFQFFADEGVLRIDAIQQSSTQQSMPMELPSEPFVFQYLAGPTGGGWDEVDERTFIMLPITNSDLVIRVRIEAWRIEAIWD
jgi:hypothetical protein